MFQIRTIVHNLAIVDQWSSDILFLISKKCTHNKSKYYVILFSIYNYVVVLSQPRHLPLFRFASVYENPGAWPVLLPNSPKRFGPCLFFAPFSTLWHAAHLCMKSFFPFCMSPILSGNVRQYRHDHKETSRRAYFCKPSHISTVAYVCQPLVMCTFKTSKKIRKTRKRARMIIYVR